MCRCYSSVRNGNTLKRAVDYTYDVRNRLDTINLDGHITDINYNADGTVNNELDVNGGRTSYEYDALKRTFRTRNAVNKRAQAVAKLIIASMKRMQKKEG